MALEPVEIVGGIAIGTGVGQAIGDVVTPKLQDFRNSVWTKYPNVPLSAHEAAELAAQGVDSPYATYIEALNTGYNQERFNELVYLAASAPGTPELLELWRRGRITKAQVTAGLQKGGLLTDYIEPVLELFTGRLDPAIIATAIQRGIMKDPGFLPVGPPTAEGNVKAFPVSDLDPIAEAQAHGIDYDRLFVETAIVGLPLSLFEAANGFFRGILTEDDFKRAVAEGNTRNEWGDAALAVAREILTANQYAELQLRGYLDRDQRLALTAQHGMTDTNSDLLYDVLGRGLNIHQALIGLRRGGEFEGPTDQIPAWALYMLERGNLRPEVYNLAYAARETYPSYFVTRALAQAGVIDQARTKELFEGLGWPLDVADAAATFYAPTTAKKADAHTVKAQTQLWNALHKSYIAESSGTSEAKDRFDLLGVPAAAQADVLSLWDSERALIRKQLTPAQIKKALGEAVVNPATGAAWTQAEALQALLDRGYNQADATVLLAE